MFLIDTYIKKTEDRGFGTFANQFVKKGDVIWQFVEGFDIKVHKNKYELLNDIQKKFVDTYFWREGDYLYSSCDHSIFQNHSTNPNSIGLSDDKMIAARDIYPNDEIIVSYYEFDDDFENYKNTLI